ncbi:hypothetical protein SCG7109_AQ_00070 [Chlamydiales bacterium SCGC AG-110-M15]|nr:hypothetical protein SCG7109_AQ_00070 [Chlamydiales bacterium SCGC AG-110-M15]
MTGIAQSLFHDKGWDILTTEENKYEPWPKLQACINKGSLLYSDRAFAEFTLESSNIQNEGTALFLCHLMASAREGHLCVRVDQSLTPDPREMWLFDNKEELYQSILSGAHSLPDRILIDVFDEICPLRPICRKGNNYYLQRHWVYEALFMKHLKRLAIETEKKSFDNQLVQQVVEEMEASGKLLKEQAQAIICASKYPLSIVTGGPGTGKTYTAANLIKVLLKAKVKENLSVVLTAPTGKAVENIQVSLNRIFTGSDFGLVIEGKTLHALLGLSRYREKPEHGEQNPLDADLIIVDESSMVDVRLMAQLFSAVKEGAHLVLLGDCNQLPPVEAGSLFADMTELCSKDNHFKRHQVHLNKCLRAELQEIVDFSAMIQKGDVQGVLNQLEISKSSDPIRHLPFKGNEEAFWEHLEARFILTETLQPVEYLKVFDRYRVLSPIRRGKIGVNAVNRHLFDSLDADAVPIMIVRNHHRLNLFNGEVGVLFRRGEYMGQAIFPGRGVDQAYFDKDLEVRRFSAALLPQYEYAYCISVHKSQGSEFDTVMLLLLEGAEVFGREIFYTAVTRAKKSLEIVGERSLIQQILSHSPKRISGILENTFHRQS